MVAHCFFMNDCSRVGLGKHVPPARITQSALVLLYGSDFVRMPPQLAPAAMHAASAASLLRTPAADRSTE